MSTASPSAAPAVGAATAAHPWADERSRPARWWPFALVVLLAAALRLSTLGLQSFWYDEAFTPLHVLHPSLWATLRSVVHTENTPPLWYLLAWADTRILGTGEIALRLPSALAGIATVAVAWAVGAELEGPDGRRRGAFVCALLVAVNPLFVWYSQEARAYGLFVFTGALALLCFLRFAREPTRGRLVLFALTGALALLTHYFAVFLLLGMALWLLARARTRRSALSALGVLALVGLALVPLIHAQGGHGTQWIGRWPLRERLEAIPQYYLTGYSGKPLGRGIELLVALPILAAFAVWLWRVSAAAGIEPKRGEPKRGEPKSSARIREGLTATLTVAAAGVLLPIALVAFGADYLAPRNLVAAMISVTVLVALLAVRPSGGDADRLVGLGLALAIALAFLAVSIDVDLSPRLQRGDWRGLTRALADGGRAERVITTVELGAAPLEYYIPGLHGLHRGDAVRVSEIDETGYAPLRASAGTPPAPGFRLRERVDVHGLIAYRFVSPVPRVVSETTLRRHVIALEGNPEVLAPSASHAA